MEVDRVEEWVWNAMVVLFYLPVALGSLLYLGVTGGEYALVNRTLGAEPWLGLALGLVSGLGMVGITRLVVPRLGAARRLAQALGRITGPLSFGSCLLVATFSALGEELLFRAVIQERLGLAAGVLLFAMAHVPLERALWPWPLFAVAAGLVLGGLYAVTGAVLAPAVAHGVVNLLNLRHLSVRYAGPEPEG